MNKNSKPTRFLPLLLALLLSTMLSVSSVWVASARENQAEPASTDRSAQPAALKFAALRQQLGEEAMMSGPPVEIQWRDVASQTGKSAPPLQPGREPRPLKLSDLEPATL